MKIIYRICVVILLFFFLIILESPGYIEPLRKYFIIHLIRIGIIFHLIYYLGKYFNSIIIRNEKVPNHFKNLLLSLFALSVLLLIAEAVFTFIPVSHTTSRTLSGQNWMYYYWHENSRCFRDKEIAEKNNSRKKIFFVGDSFTAGHGLKKCSDRFSDVAGKILSPEYEFYNLGVNGADTDDEFRNLLTFPFKPDVIVLQYFFNDIDNASKRAGKWKPFPLPYSDVPLWQRPFVRGSFLLNFIYWKFPHSNEYDYETYLSTVYKDSVVLADHLRSLKRFIDYSRKNRTDLYVILFPFLQNIELSKQFSEPVINFFTSEKISVLDVSELAADVPVTERVVNQHDFHASVLINRRVGEKIAVKIKSRKIQP